MHSERFQAEFAHHVADSAHIHDNTILDAPCQVGERSTVFPFSRLMSFVMIGEDCHVGHRVTIGSGVIVGNHVRVLDGSLLISGVILNDHVYCGPNTTFLSPRRLKVQPGPVSRVSPTLIRSQATLSASVIIAAGVTIGKACFIEPYSVVDQNTPDFAIMGGNPLRLLGWRCHCSHPLTFAPNLTTTECASCGSLYLQENDTRITLLPDAPNESEAALLAQ